MPDVDTLYIILGVICSVLVVLFLYPFFVKGEITEEDSAFPSAWRPISIAVPGEGSKPPVFLTVPAIDKATYDWRSLPPWLRKFISHIAGYLPDRLHKFVVVSVTHPDKLGEFYVSIVSSRKVKTGKGMDYAWTLSARSHGEDDSAYRSRLQYYRDGLECSVHGEGDWVRGGFINRFLELLWEDARN